MDITTFMIAVYCLVEDFLAGKRLRKRGAAPTLPDSEVLTMEIVGEFLGIDTEIGMFRYFRQYYADWFPKLLKIDRTTFTRQAANLWKVKQSLHQEIVQKIPHDPYLSLVDSFPVPVCRFARAYRCRSFGGVAAYGHDHVARQTFYGFRAHLRLAWPGVIVDYVLAPANLADTDGAEELFDGACGYVLADRNYWKPILFESWKEKGLYLLAPYKSAKREKQPWPRFLIHARYRIETVFAQLAERFHAKRVWARDLWHLTSRWARKLLSHLLAVFFCFQLGLQPLSFSHLISA